MKLPRLLRAFALSLVLLGTPLLAGAQAITAGNTGLAAAGAGTGIDAKCQGTDCAINIAAAIITTVLAVSGVVLLILFLYAGFLWMTSGGDTEGVKKAKSTIISAGAGLLIVFASYAAASFVLQSLSDALVGTPNEHTTNGGTDNPGVNCVPGDLQCQQNNQAPKLQLNP